MITLFFYFMDMLTDIIVKILEEFYFKPRIVEEKPTPIPQPIDRFGWNTFYTEEGEEVLTYVPSTLPFTITVRKDHVPFTPKVKERRKPVRLHFHFKDVVSPNWFRDIRILLEKAMEEEE